MIAARIAFLAALSLVVVLVVALTIIIFRAALRTDGGSHLGTLLVRRLVRSPESRSEFNRWAFYLHRLTGLGVFAFLCLHIADVSLFAFSPRIYDGVHTLYGSPPLRVLECGLLFAILFHTFNGLRLVAVDVADLGRAAATRILVGVAASAAVLGILGSVYILAPVFT